MSFTQVTLTGTVWLQPGVAAKSAGVSLRLSNEISDGTTVLEPFTNTATTASDGTFSLTVPANDDLTTTPTGTYYTVTITSDHGTQLITYEVIVPHATSSVDLFSLARLSAAPTPSTPFVTSLYGLNGVIGITSPDSSVNIGTSGNNITLEAVGGGSGDFLPLAGGTMTGPIIGFQDKGGQVFNVKAYGAKGDNSTDDTTDITAAINAAHTAGGGTVFFPPADYKISAALPIYSDIKYLGTYGTALHQTSTTAQAFYAEIVSNGSSIVNVAIEDLTINGPGSGSMDGIYMQNTAATAIPYSSISFKNLTINGFGNYAINGESLIASTFYNVVTTGNTAGGFFMNGAAQGTDTTVNTSLTFVSCYANNVAAAIGFNLVDTTYTTFISCAADHADLAYTLNGCDNVTFVSTGCEWVASGETATGQNGWEINNCFNITLLDAFTFEAGGTSVWVTGGSSLVTLIGFNENSPKESATSLKVDNPGQATSLNCHYTSGTNIATGADHSVLDDGLGNLTMAGGGTFGGAVAAAGNITAAHSGSNPTIKAFAANLTDYVEMYMASFGAVLQSSIGLVISPVTGVVTVSSVNSPQFAVQYGGASFGEMTFLHDDTNGTIATSIGDLILSPTTGHVHVPTPTNTTDAATKTYVDTAVAGVGSPLTFVRTKVTEAYDFWNGITNTPFSATTSGTGAAVGSQGLFIFNIAGTVQLTLQNTPSAAAINIGTSALVNGGGNVLKTLHRFSTSAVTNVTDEYVLRFGFLNSVTSTVPTNGAWFEVDLAGNGSVHYFAVTAANSVYTRTDTGIAMTVNGNFDDFEIDILSTSSVNFYIDGSLVANNTTNIPSGASQLFGHGAVGNKTAGSSAIGLRWDYIVIDVEFGTSR